MTISVRAAVTIIFVIDSDCAYADCLRQHETFVMDCYWAALSPTVCYVGSHRVPRSMQKA
ncbi:hypothetical protein BN2475_240030 [Paraburkholderia ribeironis]|uniref:Uncharacterized protein n=1 Tax=Paraburkholderia ribeironis TaxID=1247936 RepID=A0A1N7RY13_9BURK|nr:hypothetical protein BN2475_240030 [Paraburkholderia ribeironis]